MDHLTTILMEFLRIDWPWIHLGSISEPGLGTRMGRPSAWPTSWAAPCSTTPPRWDASQLCPWDVETQRGTSRVEGGFPLSLKGFSKNRESEGFQDVTYGFCRFIQQGFYMFFTYVDRPKFPQKASPIGMGVSYQLEIWRIYESAIPNAVAKCENALCEHGRNWENCRGVDVFEHGVPWCTSKF